MFWVLAIPDTAETTQEFVMGKEKDDGCTNPIDEDQLSKTKLAIKIFWDWFFPGYTALLGYIFVL